MTAGSTGRRRQRRKRGNAGGVPAAVPRGGPSSGPSGSNGGRVVLRRSELLSTTTTTASRTESVYSVDLLPSASVMPFLFRLSSCYQRLRWLRATITWRPSCGTTTSGIITYGVAFNGSANLRSRHDITSLTPVSDHPVWSAAPGLRVPSDLLMSRKWYLLNSTGGDSFDKSPGRFWIGLTHDSSSTAQSRGEFWISYTVEMEGTNPE